MLNANECALCGSVEFELSHGHFFCSECGTQSQDAREEVAEEDDTFYRTIKRVKTVPKDDISNPQTLCQLEKWQVVLQSQCDALINLGFDPALKEAVRMIWFLYLKHYGYAFTDPTLSSPAPKQQPVRTQTRRNRRAETNYTQQIVYPFLDQSCDGGLKNKKRKSKRNRPQKHKQKHESGFSRKKEVNEEDECHNDDHLFESYETDSPSNDDDDDAEYPLSNELSGMDLYVNAKKTDSQGMGCFSLKHTVSLCYLGLLYAKQNVLVSDLSRWTSQNRLPYNNVASFLPGASRAGIGHSSAVVWVPLPAERIYNMAASLYMSLPLPLIPPADASYICHVLVDRLHLSPSFHSIVDKALSCLAWPKFAKSFNCHTGVYTQQKQHFDGECMALIVMLVRLFYKLDDRHEFKLCRLATTRVAHCVQNDSRNGSLSTCSSEHVSNTFCGAQPEQVVPSKFLYVWEDWVVLFNKHHVELVTLPNERELDFVKDFQEYLDFIRMEVFSSTRPFSTRASYNPGFYSDVASIFKNVSTQNSEKLCPADVCHDFKGDNFCPRVIPLETLLKDPEAPWNGWTDYEGLRRTCHVKTLHLGSVQLSKSLLFLLKVCSNLVDIQLSELYHLVQRGEHTVLVQNIAKVVSV